MPKQQTNKLKYSADLCKLGETIDPDTDRPILSYPKVRNIRYDNIGVTANDRFLTKDTNEVVKKIETRLDRDVENNQQEYRIKIADRMYNIERVYTREEDRVMELSLAYAN